MAEASFAAESKKELARLRSSGGNHAPIAFAFAGNVGASATPSRKRAAKKPPTVGVAAAHAQLVEQHADRKLAHRIGPAVRAGKIAEHDVGQAKGIVQRIVRDRKIDAVEKVDQHADAEECSNRPAARRSICVIAQRCWHQEVPLRRA
jgi:hypothetical protein